VVAALRCAAALSPFGEGDGGSAAASRWASGLLVSAAMPGRDGLDLRSALAILRALRALGAARRAPAEWVSAVFPSTPSSSSTAAGLGLIYYSPEQAAEALSLVARLSAKHARPPESWARRALDKALSSPPSAVRRLSTPLLASLMAATAELGVIPDPAQADALVEEVGRRMSKGGGGGSSKVGRLPHAPPPPPLTQAQLRGVQRALVAWGYRPSHGVGRLQWLAVREASKVASVGRRRRAAGGGGTDKGAEGEPPTSASAAPRRRAHIRAPTLTQSLSRPSRVTPPSLKP
jgi:hypothetical protein